MSEVEKKLYDAIKQMGVDVLPNWESMRQWLNDRQWKINVLSDYPQNEIKFTIRNGFERIEFWGHSDLEVLMMSVLEVQKRINIHGA